jgi:3-hydroxybutyryl-CoA dehydrogenase
MSDEPPVDRPIRTVAVVGGGTMGHGIAYVAGAAGFRVRLFDVAAEARERALSRIRALAEKGVKRGKLSEVEAADTIGAVTAAPSLEAAVDGADLVIEAIPERLELKLALFQELDRCARPEAVLASNTSSFSISRLAGVTRRPERVLGLHFFNPVHVMALVEVVRGGSTAEEVVDRGVSFARWIGKEPVVVNDSPGFATSRLGVVLGLEAIRMVEEGVASAEEIDRAMVLGYNHPMGPLRLTDLVGLDVRLGIAEYLQRELGSERYRPPELLRRLVAEGRLGQKSGRGFYEWSGG